MDHLRASVPYNARDADHADGFKNRGRDGGHLRRLHVGAKVGFIEAGEALGLRRFPAKALDDADAGQRLL